MLKLNIGKRIISTENPAFIMGIVNATPDSFYAESRGGLERALKLIEEGADILDIGGESTRPGFTEVSAEEEIKRVIPLIKELRKVSDIPISVDTRKAEVFKAACQEGADILNDVSALEDDTELGKVAAKNNSGVILMHRFNESEKDRITNPQIEIFIEDYFKTRIEYALQQGIKEENIILDPGIGFGKTYEENLKLIKQGGNYLNQKYPVLMALSRKRCIGTMTNTEAENRLTGTITANLISIKNGAKVIRVHDVKEQLQALQVVKSLEN